MSGELEPISPGLYEWVNSPDAIGPSVIVQLPAELAGIGWDVVCEIHKAACLVLGVEQRAGCSVSSTAGYRQVTLSLGPGRWLQIFIDCRDPTVLR